MLDFFRFIVKRFEQTKRSLGALSFLFAACTISVLQPQPSALSQPSGAIASRPSDLICYMQKSNGSMINLSRFCGEDSNTVVISTTDQRFLELYQRSLKKRSGGSRSTQAALTQAQQNPRSVIERAQAVCTGLRSGQSQSQTLRQGGKDPLEATALEYYCPELGE